MSRRREGRQDRAQPARPSGLLQRKCACGRQTIAGGECASCREARLLQRAPAGPAPAPAVSPIVGEVLRTPGQPLDAATRAYMEPRFGHDFGDVQVHTGAQAAESAAAVDALAYTVGRDVVFGQGQYRPDSAEGRQLLAHELAHVVQQGGVSGVAINLTISQSGDTAEREAEEVAHAVSKGEARKPTALKLSTAIICRQGQDEYPGTIPRIVKLSKAADRKRWKITVVRPGLLASPREVSLATFFEFWGPSGTEIWTASNAAYKKAWQDITRQAGLPAQIRTPGVSIELWDAPYSEKPEERVTLWLKGHRDKIAAAEAKHTIDRRAIGGAIAWEALNNVWTTFGFGNARFSGPGKVHRKESYFSEGDPVAEEVEQRGMLPQRSLDERHRVLQTPEGAIAYIVSILSIIAGALRDGPAEVW